MKVHLPRWIAAIVLLLSVCASRLDADAQWTEYTNPAGRMAFSMPCAPQWKSTHSARLGTMPAGTSHVGMCRAGDETYLAGWVDYEPNHRPETKAELEANRDNFFKGLPGSLLLTSTSVTYQGLPGLDLTGRAREWHITGRVILDDVRPYMLAVVTPLNADRSQNINRFMTSLRITPR